MHNNAGLGAATEAIRRSEKLWMRSTGEGPQRAWKAEDEDGGEGMKVTLLRPRPDAQREEEEEVEVMRPMSDPGEWEVTGGGGGGGEGGELDAEWLSGGESRRFHRDNFEHVLKDRETQRTVQVGRCGPEPWTRRE